MSNLLYLQTFVTFVSSRNIHTAARHLNCSPSTVSLHLQQLEEIIGFQLFRFDGKKKVLTPAGKVFFDTLSPRLASVNDCLISSGQVARLFRQRLRIGGRREILSRLAPTITFSGELEFVFLPEAELHERFAAQDLDIAIVHDKNAFSSQILLRRLFFSRPLLAVHKKWVTGAGAPTFGLNAAFLQSVPSVSYGTMDARLQLLFDKIGVDPRCVHTAVRAEDWGMLSELVLSGIGYGVLPDHYLHKSEQLLSLVVPDHLIPSRCFYLAYRKPVQKLFREGKLVVYS